VNETIRVIQNRRSTRAYEDRPIDRDTTNVGQHYYEHMINNSEVKLWYGENKREGNAPSVGAK